MHRSRTLLSPNQAFGFVLIGLLSGYVIAQDVTVPPNITLAPGTHLSTLTINAGGYLTPNQLTLTAGGGETALTAQASSPATATGVFKYTTINLGNGKIGIEANGSGARITVPMHGVLDFQGRRCRLWILPVVVRTAVTPGDECVVASRTSTGSPWRKCAVELSGRMREA